MGKYSDDYQELLKQKAELEKSLEILKEHDLPRAVLTIMRAISNIDKPYICISSVSRELLEDTLELKIPEDPEKTYNLLREISDALGWDTWKDIRSLLQDISYYTDEYGIEGIRE